MLLKSSILAPCALVLVGLSACADEDWATIVTEHPPLPSDDAALDVGSPKETGTEIDAGASDDGVRGSDGAQRTDAMEGGDGSRTDAGDGSSLPDAARRDGGPGGDGGLVIVNDGAASDASFQIKNAAGTNLLSFSDIHADCNAVAGTPAGTFVMTCQEKSTTTYLPVSASAGPCRTVTVTFATNPTTGPTTGLTLAVVAKPAPAQGEAFVVYQESIDCTLANTNGWSVAQAGGTLKIDTRGDTGMNFTLADASLAPSSTAGVVNQNAMGTFVLSGNGFSRFPFGIK